ncbi:MAG: hypothetical protein KIB00_14710 [Paeniclostridium sordellii]|uniref:hypothetical protein n=1 Tax=Paraclostridium sordellii TaxID=1505 RepID=UPI0005DAED08|nr:hypothetical protein [Paeniclostridium sordellii]MBS6025326.1 hypothetical protein [Paeniclostridium sordellii]CEN94064.1 Lipid A core-O-antigen ligase and related enzymes [[Clostridium] sordellii] [Paeniclostridium sordellii]CEN96066.1 Lipid A core-O-antigen ligase and related enzymes [[Clostridium] sordellii] [Paeniclostridium sordellii]
MLKINTGIDNIGICKKDKFIMLMWTSIIVLLMIGHMINRVEIKLIAISISTIIYLNVKAEIKFYLLLYSLPFINFLRIGNENFSFLNIWTIMIFINLIMYNPKLKKSNLVIIISLILIISFNVGNMGIGAYIGVLLNVMLFFMTCILDYKDKFKIGFFHASIFISTGYLVSSVIGIVMRIVSPNQLGAIKLFSAIPGELNSKTVRFTGLMVDPNYYAQGILICMACIMVCIINWILNREKNLKVKKIYLIFILIPLVLFGLLSYSKMFMIVSILMISIFTIYVFITKGNPSIKIISVIFIIAISILSIDSVTMILERVVESENITSGRFEIFLNCIKIIYNSSIIDILIGIGVGGNLAIMTFGTALHNLYLEYISSIGILGTLIWLLLLCKSIRRCYKFKILNIYKFLPLLTILITGIALDGVWAKWHYFYIILSINSINLTRSLER